MNTYKLIVRVVAEPGSGGSFGSRDEHTLYVEADSEAAARAVVARRAFVVLSVAAVTHAEVPAGAGVQRVRAAAPARGIIRDNPAARRTLFMFAGIGLGLAVIIGTVFVLRAREHLTRSDIQPRTPSGVDAERSADDTARRAVPPPAR